MSHANGGAGAGAHTLLRGARLLARRGHDARRVGVEGGRGWWFAAIPGGDAVEVPRAEEVVCEEGEQRLRLM